MATSNIQVFVDKHLYDRGLVDGLEKGLSWFREMQDYEVETDVEGMEQFIPHILHLIEADYLERLEKEKAGLLNG